MARPVPVPDALTAPYWEAASQHVLTAAQCSQCSAFAHPPDDVCRSCGTLDPGFAYVPVRGRGVIRSWTVVRRPLVPGFDDVAPFTLVDVELDEDPGLRVVGRLLRSGDGAPAPIGAAVAVAFEDIAPGVAIPAFTLAGAP